MLIQQFCIFCTLARRKKELLDLGKGFFLSGNQNAARVLLKVPVADVSGKPSVFEPFHQQVLSRGSWYAELVCRLEYLVCQGWVFPATVICVQVTHAGPN